METTIIYVYEFKRRLECNEFNGKRHLSKHTTERMYRVPSVCHSIPLIIVVSINSLHSVVYYSSLLCSIVSINYSLANEFNIAN